MIICIVGPTGVGKSNLAIKIASQVGGEIINGDAFQVYQKMNIGTAKPSEEELTKVPHHLFSYLEPSEEFSIFEYQQNLRNKIEELKSRNKPIIIVGGSGLYLKSGLYDYSFNQESIRVDLSKYEAMDNLTLYHALEELDYESAQKIHFNNRKRLLRAIEIYLQTGTKKSDVINMQKHELLYPVSFIGLTKPRDELYSIINRRVEIMVEQGLFEEVDQLLKEYLPTLKSFQAIGYKEIIQGRIDGLSSEKIIELIQKNSRNYAKRQFTFFKNQIPVEWFDDVNKAYEYSISKIKE